MRILLTNDDGFRSPGLHSLKKILEKDHEIWIIAPDGERSGNSHRITLRGPVKQEQVEDRVYSCSGTPADCVIIGANGAMPAKPDMIISGINIGPNIGTDVIYSGTAAAARQGTMMGIPSVALSLDSFTPPFHFDRLSRFVARNLDLFMDLWKPDHFVNLNAPNQETYQGVAITHPSRRLYRDRIDEYKAPDGRSYFFVHGFRVETVQEEGSDWDAVSQGKVSISPVVVQPCALEDDNRYRDARFVLE